MSEVSMTARRPWRVLVQLFALALVGAGGRAADDPAEARLKKDVTFLASPECEGRGVNTEGINRAADYIAAEFKQAGLKPVTANPGYFQPFTMTGKAKLEGPNTLSLRGPLGQEIQLKADEHFKPLGLSGAGKLTAPVVFAGYGASAKDAGYDDFKGVDVAGKVVVVLRKTPRTGGPAPFDGDNSSHHAALATKLTNADLHKAAAVLFVNDADTAKDKDPLMEFGYTAPGSGGNALPALHVRRHVVDAMLRSALGTSLAQAEADIDHDLKPRSAALPGWTATMEVNVRRPTLAVKNVVGVLEGAGPLANETVVIGAHYDHLGYGESGSLARKLGKPAIHHGADDNASGTSVLIELARRFSALKDRQGRRLVFIAFSGEESGLLGSAYYCKNPLFPLEDTVAMVNLDMVGRLRPDKETQKDKLIVYGTGTSKEFDGLIEKLNTKFDFQLRKVPGGSGPSDHASFYAKQIPVLFFFTDDHEDYHRPSDTADKVNVAGMRRIADLTEHVATYLAAVKERPNYIKIASPARTGGPAGPRIGIRPSYGDDKDGVLLDGVVEGGAASKAGLKEGDRIVELGGRPVKNLEGYMVLMRNHKKGDKVELGVLRDGKKVVMTVVPE
jgi:hypothetical protein